jgi:hypothetical protein
MSPNIFGQRASCHLKKKIGKGIVLVNIEMEEMNMKFKMVLLVIMVLSASLMVAQEPPKPVLVKGDVVKFIKTFPLLKKDLKRLGATYSAKNGNVTIPEALKASEEYNAILKKHGWDEHFFVKFMTIARAYSTIVYGKEIKNADPKIAKAIKDIESNPHLSADMKEKLKAQLLATRGILKQQGKALMQNLHPKDLALVKPRVKELKAVMEESGKD